MPCTSDEKSSLCQLCDLLQKKGWVRDNWYYVLVMGMSYVMKGSMHLSLRGGQKKGGGFIKVGSEILDNGQKTDGSVKIPDALVPYFGSNFLKTP